jgi:hypothetical protein
MEAQATRKNYAMIKKQTHCHKTSHLKKHLTGKLKSKLHPYGVCQYYSNPQASGPKNNACSKLNLVFLHFCDRHHNKNQCKTKRES